MNLQSKVKLNSGAEIPVLGLGVFRSKYGEETYNAVRSQRSIGRPRH